MISYNDLYELVRKEKYSEVLLQLPKTFLEDISDHLNSRKEQDLTGVDMFSEAVVKAKKQFENFVVLFRELMLRRKKKLLNLVFVAAETGIMKRDYETMLPYEREMFEQFVRTFEEGDKELGRLLSGRKNIDVARQKMVLFGMDVEQFVDSSGNVVGPFSSGMLANLDSEVADILVAGGKAQFVDEQ